MSSTSQRPKLSDNRPRLVVMGVGGAGGNAVNNMIASGLSGVEFIVANTDAQSLAVSSAERRIQLGVNLTEGLGAGSRPEIGEAAAEEAIEDIRGQIAGAHMLFVAAGMGGGTGTGAAGVIARVGKELGVLTVGVVTRPFLFEGARRSRVAEIGIGELKKYVDTLIVIPNQNLFRIANEKTTFAEAFVLADQVLYSGIACIVDLIVKDGLINLDFADVRTVMSGMGTAMMGTGEATGARRAVLAAEEAIANPLLDDVSLKGAKGLLLSIIGGKDLTLYEVDEAASRVRQEVDAEANIIVGATFDENLGDRVRVSIVASGMARASEQPPPLRSAPGAGPPPRQPGLEHPAYTTGYARMVEAPPGSAATHRDPGSAPRMTAGAVASREQERGNPRRSVWRGPGGVVIEPGPPQLGALHHPPPLPATEPPRGADTFAPAPPTPVERRRVPPLEDFPMVGQLDYRAKTGRAPERGAAAGSHLQRAPLDSTQRKRGILQRLIGRKDEEAAGRPSAPRATTDAAPAWDRTHERQRAPDAAEQSGPQEVENVDLPVFFNRERK